MSQLIAFKLTSNIQAKYLQLMGPGWAAQLDKQEMGSMSMWNVPARQVSLQHAAHYVCAVVDCA